MNDEHEQQRYSRQGFIGDHSLVQNARIGLVGLGGGGSAVLTQLVHIGFQDIVGYDPNVRVEEKHLNRTFGLTSADVANGISKVQNAERIVKGVQPCAKATFIKARWQDDSVHLRSRDIVFGCLDGFSEREQLEMFCRRHLIPYVDIGLGVRRVSGAIPSLAGQIILSMPGHLCMRCMGFLNEENLAKEASEYGEAGVRPQVIWGNAVLSGVAVGVAVKLLTGWAGSIAHPVYLQFDGNQDLVGRHVRLRHLPADLVCSHFPLDALGQAKLESF